MEVDGESSESPDVQQKIAQAEPLWTVINATAKKVFLPKKSEPKITMKAFVNVLNSDPEHYIKLLIPPFDANPIYDNLKSQYSAFTMWLFGILFHVTGDTAHSMTLVNSLDVQAAMLRLLARLHVSEFERITQEYLRVLDIVLDFEEHSDEERLVIKGFFVETTAIERLQLIYLPMKVTKKSVITVVIGILRVILKSKPDLWNRRGLWARLMRLVINGELEVKLACMKIVAHLPADDNVAMFIKYSIEIVRNINIGERVNGEDLRSNLLNETPDILNDLIKSLMSSEGATDLAFAIIEALVAGRLSSTHLEISAVCKIRDYLLVHPRAYTAAEGVNLMKNVEKCTDFHKILSHFIVHELNTSTKPGALIAIQASSLWRTIHQKILESLESRKFAELKKLLEIARTVSLWMISKKIRGQLFESARGFFNNLNDVFQATEDQAELYMIYECFIELLAIEEFPKEPLQKILLLPWYLDKYSGNVENSRRISNILKNLDVKIKLRCLNVLCEFGQGPQRVKFLSTCVTNLNVEVATAAILNSVLLLTDPEITFSEISAHILNPALVGERLQLQEAVAKVIGSVVCFVSGKSKIMRPEWDCLDWSVVCSVCDKYSKKKSIFHPDNNINEGSGIGDEGIFTNYLSLINWRHTEVRRNMSDNLIRLSNHLDSFSTANVSQAWISRITDSCLETRRNVAKSIAILARNKLKYIIKNGGLDKQRIMHEPPRELEKFSDLIVDELGDGLTSAFESSDEPLQITIIHTAKEFAKAEMSIHERRLCRVFIITIMHSESFTAVAAGVEAFKEVAEYHSLTPYELFLRYRKDFIELITQILCQKYVERNYSIVKSLSKIVRCFGYSGHRDFLSKHGSLLVRHLVPLATRNQKIQELFQMIADAVGIEMRRLLLDYFAEICSHVFLEETPDQAAECLELVAELTGQPIPEMMRCSFIGIFQKLLLHFHDKMERVLIYLELISEYDPNDKGNFESNEEIARYLRGHLHAVLVKFDQNLGPLSDEFTQKTALSSLGTLLKFMGCQNISSLRYKILTTLRTCLLNLKRPGFMKLSLFSWDCFVRSVSFTELGPMLPTICVSLSPLLETYPEEVTKILDYLLIENHDSIARHISEIFFIDDLKVSPRIASVVATQIKRNKPKSFEEGVRIWLRRIKHETDEVRLKALIELKKFLERHRSHLNALILNHSNVHPLVVELLDSLLIGCQEKDENIRLRCGECLGELGAVEPSLLPRRIVSRDDSKFIPQMNEEFASEVLQEFARALQMETDTHNVSCFSLAIQEILKAFDISPSGKNSRIWSALSSTIRERIYPLLSSRYKHTAEPDVADAPIYGSAAGSTFEKWIYHWACSMIAAVKQPNLSTLLMACQPGLKRDTRTTIVLVPYVFLHIIANGQDEDRDRLITEVMAVINSGDQALDQELITTWPLRREINVKYSTEETIRVSDEARRIRCSQVVFNILDQLGRWLTEKRNDKDNVYRIMEAFFNRLDSLVLAKACYKSHEYHRALMLLERHMSMKNKGLEDQAESSLLTKIYIQLEEPDGVSGILATQKQNPTLEQLVVGHEVDGQLQDAAICYEKLAQKSQQLKHIQGMIHCYLDLDQAYTAMKFTEGVISSRPELEPLVVEREPFWRLANFVQLAGDNKNPVKKDLLEDLRKGTEPNLEGIKRNLVCLLGAVSHKVSYLQQSYPYILKLHILNEFEKATSLLMKSTTNLPKILNEWEQRDQLIRASRGVEPVLGMRRATLDLFTELLESVQKNDVEITAALNIKKEIGKMWLKSAKIARKSGLYQQAYKYILSASDSCPQQELNIEQAQLYWQRDFQEEALMTLKRSFTNCFQPTSHYEALPHDVDTPDRRNFAKAKLLFAKYNEEMMKVSTMVNKEYYKEAYNSLRCWEKTPLAFAQYTESLIENCTEAQKDLCDKELYNVINYCGRSLQFGCKYVHQSMPKMLTTWMDFAEKVHRNRNPSKERVEMVKKMTNIIDAYCTRLPTYIWLTALSQLISRISHPSRVVQEQLIKILVKLIIAHPQYCLWMMACVLNSEKSPATAATTSDSKPISFKDRIWYHKELRSPDIRKTMESFRGLWQKLISFTAYKIESGVSKLKVSTICKDLPVLLRSPEFGPIMMPTTQFFNLSLPTKNSTQANNLSNDNISIVGIEEDVLVMASVQKPKRITLRGSDGRRYIFMCKPADDLRRDFRLMEFNGIVNKYLQKDPDSRQRRLYIRTYSVVPLSEDCGIIEWVQNLLPFRQALLTLYKEKGLGMGNREVSKLVMPLREKLAVKRKVFLEKLLPRYPPVLGDWFRIRFPEPYAWYEARNAYIRTTAVMSMVGYILGLGDRHGENILFDCTCGDAVHVDFNCLFNAGETLTFPERVPFRLTHNMVSAMGPLKYEGPFRKSCEVTLRLLRRESKTLLSVLKPFLYTENATQAEINLKRIEKRLAGFVTIVDKKDESSDYRSIPSTSVKFGVEGQVNHLIQEAIDVDNLCRMYFGWGAHL